MSTTTKNRRKVLVPLATMAIAGAVAVGSGATFTSTTAHSVAVTSGTLSHSNDQNGLTLTVANIRPGDTKTGTVTITNDGTLDSTLSLEETSDSSNFIAGALKLKIQDGTTVVYDGNFGAMANEVRNELGSLPVGAKKTLTFTVSMTDTATNDNQGKQASASYRYVTTQVGDNSSVGWLK